MKKLLVLLAKAKIAAKNFSKALVCAAALGVVTLPAQAATYQDLWYNPAEPGWGVNIAQQGNTLFATWFVYGTDDRPVWYVMSNGQKTGPGEVFTGAVYELRGTYLGVPWLGARILAPDTGVATFIFTDKKTLSLRYSINGDTVQKNITRQTFAVMPVGGTYFGVETGQPSTGCNPSTKYVASQRYTINTNFPAGTTTGSFSMQTIDSANVVCNYTGTATQYGSLIEISNGAYSCSNSSAGAFAATDGIFNEEGFLLKTAFTLSNACSVVGRIGGARF